MKKGIFGIEVLEGAKLSLREAVDFARSLKDCSYADLRMGLVEARIASSENGTPKVAKEDAHACFGVRVIAGQMPAWGCYAQPIGRAELKGTALLKALRKGIDRAYQRAMANSQNKQSLRELAPALSPVKLASIKVCKDTVPARFDENPRQINIREVLSEAIHITRQAKSISPEVRFAFLMLATGLTRELFFSTEGAEIDQAYALSQATLLVVAQKGGGLPESFMDHIGGHGGWEVVKGKNVYRKSFLDFALERAKDTVELAGAEFLPSTDEPVTVVTDPHFNALLVHEIIGHPTEADRALKMETAYAGRSWLLRGLNDNELGKQIASPLITAFSDPTIEGYGNYKYDAEGVPGRRVTLIEKGIFKGFMNGRETASLLNHEPNGSMRATECHYVPLVRMTNTVIAPGDRNPQDILSEVEEGYYVVNHRIPSISESRENFRISAQKVYKIENGRPVRLYRGGGITSDSKEFLMSIDAVGNDLIVFPIPNCGKGQPMQVMRVGNGGPTLRGKARLTGEYRR
jgi:TldD protein